MHAPIYSYGELHTLRGRKGKELYETIHKVREAKRVVKGAMEDVLRLLRDVKKLGVEYRALDLDYHLERGTEHVGADQLPETP